MNDRLRELVTRYAKWIEKNPPTPEELKAQEIAFAYYNLKIERPELTLEKFLEKTGELNG